MTDRSPPLALSRRSLIAGMATAGAASVLPAQAAAPLPTKRPPLSARAFASPAVEQEIARISARIADPELAWMFGNCYPNTLDTTVEMGTVEGAPDAFVITGDIPCLWLRDSSAQVYTYIHLARRDARIRLLARGLIARHVRSILLDPYANAFMRDPGARTNLDWAQHDRTDMKPGVAERKWEIDSLAHVIRLHHRYWTETRDAAPFDARWADAMRAVVRTFREQQRKDGPGPYSFQRPSERPTDSVVLDGYGAPTRKVGLIHSMFRPSDDSCVYPLFVPANLFAVSSLRQLAELAGTVRRDGALAADATALANEVERALRQHGLARGPGGQPVWAFEVDGFGNTLFMDDANAPSLSSLAYLGAVPRDDALFRRTEALCWSAANPYFFRGTAGEGIGGPHIGLDQIWPMSLIVRALSSDDPQVIRACLRTLKTSHAGTGFMHESFDANDPRKFSRAWFAWANGLFGELIVTLARTRPAILAEPL